MAFTSEDRVRDVIHNFDAGGFCSLYPKYAGGRLLSKPEDLEDIQGSRRRPVPTRRPRQGKRCLMRHQVATVFTGECRRYRR
nr:hypothetical protein [Nocardiopsis ganjiahuensis]